MSMYYVVIPVLGTGHTAVKMPDLVLVSSRLQLIQTLPTCEWQALNPHPNYFPEL